jgi:hypothetical protein
MAPIVLLLNASKVAGVVGAITVAANALAFRHFHHKNLAPFDDPVDESNEVLAAFPIDKDGNKAFRSAGCYLSAPCEEGFVSSWLARAGGRAGGERDCQFGVGGVE